MPTVSLPAISRLVTAQAPTVAGSSTTITPLTILRLTTVRRGPRAR